MTGTTDEASRPKFTTRIPVIYGAGGIGDPGTSCRLTTAALAQPVLSAWCAVTGPSAVDTSDFYGFGSSERILSQMDLHGCAVDTKAFPVAPGDHSYARVKEKVRASVERLGGIKVRTVYLHAPDRTVNWLDTLRALDELHREGLFTYLGLSNFTSYEVAELLFLARAHNLLAPTIYQGLYNPLDRTIEYELIPCLRRHNLKFAAYSPLAGGLLSGALLDDNPNADADDAEPLVENPAAAGLRIKKGGRFDPSERWSAYFTYRYGWMVPHVRELKARVEAAGLNLNQASVRWLQHHSMMVPEDWGIVFGGSKVEHVERTLAYCQEGPLPEEVVLAFEETWQKVKGRCPSYVFNPQWYSVEKYGY